MPLMSESPTVMPIHRKILAFSFIGWIFDFYDLLLLSFLVSSTTLIKDLALSRDQVMTELAPRALELARMARAHDLNLTVDAEEADRLELTLDVLVRFGRLRRRHQGQRGREILGDGRPQLDALRHRARRERDAERQQGVEARRIATNHVLPRTRAG